MRPECRVKVTIRDKFVDAVVERTHFISKVSFDCCYCFATAKASVKVSRSDSDVSVQRFIVSIVFP